MVRMPAPPANSRVLCGALLIAALTGPSACSLISPISPAPGGEASPPADAAARTAKLIRQMAERDRELVAMQTGAVMEYSGSGRALKARENLSVLRPADLRVEAMSPFGVELVVAASPDHIGAFEPRRNELYVGRANAESLERFANIRFILSHAGGTLPFLAWRLSVAPMIDKRLKQRTREEIFAGLKTFWYDNALACGAAPMGALSRIAAADRIVFGSDWPFCNDRVVAEEVADFTAPDFLPPQTVAAIARDNALKLFPGRAGDL